MANGSRASDNGGGIKLFTHAISAVSVHLAQWFLTWRISSWQLLFAPRKIIILISAYLFHVQNPVAWGGGGFRWNERFMVLTVALNDAGWGLLESIVQK